ncbi:hypothetical protein D9M69_532830 [compost metagenome]
MFVAFILSSDRLSFVHALLRSRLVPLVLSRQAYSTLFLVKAKKASLLPSIDSGLSVTDVVDVTYPISRLVSAILAVLVSDPWVASSLPVTISGVPATWVAEVGRTSSM